MDFNNSIMLDTYSNNANKQFCNMQSRLSEIENSFQTKMDGKTTIGLVGSLIGTIAWLAVYIVCAVLVRNIVDSTLLLIAVAIIGVLILFMLIDNIMDFSYYGKIASYKNSISRLQSRVRIGKDSIKSNHDEFMNSRARGWDFFLNAAQSIPEEASSFETTMSNMEALKKGFVNSAKNFFFYASVVAITVVGCVALFPSGSYIITSITHESFSSDTLMTFNVIALLVIGVGELVLAKLVWSKTDCNVTKETLLISVLGPIAFLGLITVATMLVMLVVWIVSIVLAILAVVAVIGSILAGTTSG